MSEDTGEKKSESGCGTAFACLIWFGWGYVMALDALDGPGDGPSLWWHYLAAIPLGGLFLGLFVVGLTFIAYLWAPVLSGVLAGWLYHAAHLRWLLTVGIASLLVGLITTGVGGSKKDPAIALNGLGIALVGIVAGIAAWLKLHP